MSDFEWTYVTTDLRMQKIIHWEMRRNFTSDLSIDFYVDKARSGGEWENVAGPLTDQCTYVDPVRWNWNKDMNTFYRIRYDRGVDDWQYSIPVRAIGGWSRQDYILAKELTRKELLSYQRLGLTGVILKRREWGPVCTTCADHDTDEAVDAQCPECFGTGITGGYYAPIVLTVNPIQKQATRQKTEMALVDDTRRQVRCVAYPTLIKENDLWLDDKNGTRWVVRGVTPVTEIKGVPIIYQLTLHRMPMTDVIYKEPEGHDKATEIPEVLPTGTEHTWYDDLCEEDF